MENFQTQMQWCVVKQYTFNRHQNNNAEQLQKQFISCHHKYLDDFPTHDAAVIMITLSSKGYKGPP